MTNAPLIRRAIAAPATGAPPHGTVSLHAAARLLDAALAEEGWPLTVTGGPGDAGLIRLLAAWLAPCLMVEAPSGADLSALSPGSVDLLVLTPDADAEVAASRLGPRGLALGLAPGAPPRLVAGAPPPGLGPLLDPADPDHAGWRALALEIETRARARDAAARRIADQAGLLDAARRRELPLIARVEILEQTLDNLRHSTSWRLTAPLRGLSGLARRLARRAPALPAGPDAVSLHRARQQAALDAFLASDARLDLHPVGPVTTTILIVLFNQAALTFGCLRALKAAAEVGVAIIIVDNASTDATGALLDRIDGATILRNDENLHFLRAVNQGAEVARGDALVLLNNDAELRPGALGAARETLLSAPDIGAVAAKIILPDGTLQEAGSVIWSDGTAAGYGRGADPSAPEYQFRRDVDYGSGAFLMVRRDLFEALGRLDPVFAPAYYEETDFCMRLRGAGWRIVYDPRVEILHVEFGSAASREEALALQRRNHARFIERHREVLARRHAPPGTPMLEARLATRPAGRVLVIDDRVPFPDLGAGYPRAARLLRVLRDQGWFVTFYPLVQATSDWGAVREAMPPEIEFMLGPGRHGLGAFLRERADHYDLILVSRPHNMAQVRRHWRPGGRARLVYDAEAVIAPREAAARALAGRPPAEAEIARALAEEIALADAADTVLAVTEGEARRFTAAGHRDVRVLGHALTPAPTARPFAERSGLLFVGALDDDPSPNVDSLLWFAGSVAPALEAALGPAFHLSIAGRAGARRVQALAGPTMRLLGRVPDLTPLYDAARVFIAPTRYAAGLPHKIHEAAAHGLPIVATPLLAAQLGWRDEVDLLVAETGADFARQCHRLHEDAALWSRLRDAALDRVARDCDPARFDAVIGTLLAGTTRR